jgi:hypothetical protein
MQHNAKYTCGLSPLLIYLWRKCRISTLGGFFCQSQESVRIAPSYVQILVSHLSVIGFRCLFSLSVCLSMILLLYALLFVFFFFVWDESLYEIFFCFLLFPVPTAHRECCYIAAWCAIVSVFLTWPTLHKRTRIWIFQDLYTYPVFQLTQWTKAT